MDSPPNGCGTEKLVLVVQYVTPSLNVTKRQHWAVQHREKHAAFTKLLCALSATASPSSTQTISPAALKTFSTAYATLALYLTTLQIKSRLSPSKKRLALTLKKRLSSK